jgi:hypothetical protein
MYIAFFSLQIHKFLDVSRRCRRRRQNRPGREPPPIADALMSRSFPSSRSSREGTVVRTSIAFISFQDTNLVQQEDDHRQHRTVPSLLVSGTGTVTESLLHSFGASSPNSPKTIKGNTVPFHNHTNPTSLFFFSLALAAIGTKVRRKRAMSGGSSNSGFGSSSSSRAGGDHHHGSTATTTTVFCNSHRYCGECCHYCTSHEFTPTQWLKGDGQSRCMNCIEQGGRVCAGPCGTWRSIAQYSRTQWRKGSRGGARCDQCIVPPPPPSDTKKKKKKKAATTAVLRPQSLPFGCADDMTIMSSSYHNRDSLESCTYYGSGCYCCYYCSYCCYDDGMIRDYYHYDYCNHFTSTGQPQQPERHPLEPEGVFYNIDTCSSNNNNHNGASGGGDDDGSTSNNSIGKDNESSTSDRHRSGGASPSCVSSFADATTTTTTTMCSLEEEKESYNIDTCNNNHNKTASGGDGSDDGSHNSIGKDNESPSSSDRRSSGVASPSCVSSLPTPPPLPPCAV